MLFLSMREKEVLVVGAKIEVKKIILSLTLTFLAFFTPFILGHPQILVGSFVNALLIITILLLPFPYSFPVILMPSLAALAKGLLFGPKTVFLYYLIPFIWFGNLVLVSVFNKIHSGNNERFFPAVFLAAMAKTAILYLPTLLLVRIKILPALFLTTMGLVQLSTAIIGGILAYFLWRFIRKFDFDQ